MADTRYVTANRLTEESKAIQRRGRNLVLLLGLPVALGGFFVHPLVGLITLAGVVALVGLVGGSAVIEAGARGEDAALEYLAELPGSFTVFNQVDLPDERSRTGVAEADLVVVGPEALFVIEVKHNSGAIDCDEQTSQWTVSKTGRRGSRYTKQMRNPVRQVKKQVWLLSEYLKGRKAKRWIQPIVLFTHPEVSLGRAGELSVPVLTGPELVEYIRSFRPERPRPVKENTVRAIAALKG
ncbi:MULTISPECIES: nuclease-related domain-containing protein [unclassified Thioalkalivibrio]|uniref:nuclease-related domain-containing protein n=1 Tax=unclassified Thioalkalivibrio TaxID=2621013 RepID=UPI00036C87F5|nr:MULTISPECIES: nuclease-related domain-containing protein [unclassified Thioalkalivibrio]